jgi:hypothetical protein
MLSIRNTAWAVVATVLSASLPGAAMAEQETVIGVQAMSQDVRVAYDKTGSAIMGHIAAAQSLMAGSIDFAGAQRETGKALALLRSLDHVSPTERFHNEMGRLLHHQRSKTPKAEAYEPVVGVLNDVKQLSGVEVEDTHNKLVKIQGKVKAEPTVDAQAELLDATDDVGYLEIDLPVQETKSRLMRAIVAMSRRDAPTANAALADAMNNTKEWTKTVHATLIEGEEAVK